MRPSVLSRMLFLLPLLLLPATAGLRAQAPAPGQLPSDSVPVLRPITVTGRADNLIGRARTASEGYVGAADLKSRPLLREGELLEAVPGVIVTQHSGDGKANQYFLRGFNLDHGTDFQTRVEGMPVNMPSHAHGQGYTDLNFMIPELVEHLDYRLGIAHAELGDFGSAGGADFTIARRLARPSGTATGGAFGMARAVAAGSARWGPGDLLVGAEVKRYDGPWQLGQDLRKLSGLGRYSWEGGGSAFSVLGMAYRSRWRATDQVPLRAVRDGRLSRFGQVDGSDGGASQRYSVSASWRHTGATATRDVQLFGIYSDLDLYSNFGYFLDDPVRGDQFNQRERRVVLGLNARHRQPLEVLRRMHLASAGVQLRGDLVDDIGLHHTQARRRIGTVREDDVRQWSAGLHAELESRWSPGFRTIIAARGDAYHFRVASDRPENSGTRTAGLISPRATVVLTPRPDLELYLGAGLGFHSNDARGVTITVDPVTGGPAERVDPLVRSRAAELGVRMHPVAGWRSTVALWALSLESELLFVGDGGATEAVSASRRAGLTIANYYRPTRQLALDLDLSLSRARFSEVAAAQDRVPGAIERVVTAGVTWHPVRSGPFGALRLRHFGSYPLLEDNQVRARPSTLVNAEIGIVVSGLRIRGAVMNLLNARARDIQYYYASRLPGEATGGVEDIHFHPSEPRQLRVTVSWGD